ncbi:MAG: hypothetical protein DI551_05340 [Micavibrio aeruginosavorus]|uniref:Cyclodipeptide synthase n=1 Tax=Micavibrio aeruginosavorus TaxID=349221 RepID=A0A2W5Q4N5_9BACT|nr:MAG: hypothetical protein DI551_05340 [Micavibrio aeruginosavorus]
MSATKYKVRCYGDHPRASFDTVRMEISVGQEYHEGQKLVAAMDWAKRHFDRIVLIVGDRIQGYNIAFKEGVNLIQAFEKATKKGDEWIERNQSIIADAEITRWSDWLSHPEYAMNRAAVGRLYAENEEFRNAVRENIKGVWERRFPVQAQDQRFLALSEQFVLEETAVFACAYKDLKGVSAYPGDFSKTWSMFKDSEIPHAPEGLKYSHCLRLQFRRREPQLAA